MLKQIIKLFNPDHGLTIHKPDHYGLINLPCGNKVKATTDLDVFSLEEIIETPDGKYYGRRKQGRKWIVDAQPIEFKQTAYEKHDWEVYSSAQKVERPPFQSRWPKGPEDEYR